MDLFYAAACQVDQPNPASGSWSDPFTWRRCGGSRVQEMLVAGRGTGRP
jgi:hypothetical protein